MPKASNKNWAHVVDARNGPGIKNVLKAKPKEQRPEVFGGIKRKHRYRKKEITRQSRASDGHQGMDTNTKNIKF